MKKLLHPLIPLLILLILGGKYVYDVFWVDKYDEKQLILLEQTKTDTENTSNLLLNVADRSTELAKKCFAEMGNPPSSKVLFDKIETLNSIHKSYLEKINKPISEPFYKLESKIKYPTKEEKQELHNHYFSVQGLEIQTLFQEYVQEIIKIDTLLAQKYQNYSFKNGESNEELADNYLNGKSIEVFIHLARIKAELAYIHSESTILLAEEYGYFECNGKVVDNVILPIIYKSEGNYGVSMIEIAPFTDSTRKAIATKEYFQTNVKYHIDEKGFFVIDEENFDIKDLKLKWFLDINHNDNHKRIYLEYGIDKIQYEK